MDDVRPRLNGDAGSPRASDPKMWWHLCNVERDMVATAQGETCSWCGREEPKSITNAHGVAIFPR